MSQATSVPGYRYGSPSLPRAPITLDELERMKQAVGFTEADVAWLRRSGDVVSSHIDQILDVWYQFIGSLPQLIEHFSTRGAPNRDYLDRVRKRFALWIEDTARADYGQSWLDYQLEIGRRHHRVGKNRIDEVDSTPIVPFRYLFPLVFPVVSTLRPFLELSGHTSEEVQAMQDAWMKSVLLQVTLWSHPYIREGDY